MSSIVPPTPTPLSPEREARLMDLRGREAAHKVALVGGPLLEMPLRRRIAFAISDPGAITPRGDNYQEPLLQWQARAVSYVLPETDSEAGAR